MKGAGEVGTIGERCKGKGKGKVKKNEKENRTGK